MSNEQRSSACPSCGVEWANHLGIVGTCAENKRLRDRLRHAEKLLDRFRKGEVSISAIETLHNDNIRHLEAARQEDAR